MTLLLTIIGAATLTAALVLLLAGQRQQGADDLLPEELKGAKLVMSERTVERRRPVHVRGRPDEVWMRDGRRIIIETKSRAGRVFASDRTQLAAYAYILRADGGPPLAPHGYVRFTGGGTVTFQKVKLKPDDTVIEAHRRLQRVLQKRETPRFATSAALCKGCGHIARCPNPQGAG